MRGPGTGLLWGGAAVALLAATQPWWTTGVAKGGVTGSQATSGAAPAVALAALAGAFLGLFLKAVGRRVVYVAVALLLAGGVPLALTVPAPNAAATLNDAVVQATAWRWVYLAGVLVGAVGAGLLVAARPAPPRQAGTRDVALDAWRALDAGQDPTLPVERATGGDAQAQRQE